MTERDYKRDAIRILFILEAGKKANTDPELVERYPFVFVGEKRLQGMDFWVRYPDYLALELLEQFQKSGDSGKLDIARAIYDGEEPSLRTIPMLRKHFGAYEPLDTALAILECRGLVRPQRRKTAVGYTHFFHLPTKASEFCEMVSSEFSVLDWYRDRATLVADVVGSRLGKELKTVQHARREYHDTEILDYIPTITEWVKNKLDELDRK
ncbi:hypothetical protein [Rhizobium leguminosarum]|uniref:hypothetical protein n=1 Tax=Rhizobium leguminosarum TaxID=384 RepID=UPI00103BCC9A|nr:hypothetical protein [Rhizobium leguminosarum]MBB4344445.1 hypothetical protein [Rhizobium leguminosarum]MBB6297517.1 hypothetical protein [Rhizobium leguminosarum]TCA52862.1 hypothetical protein E0H71_16480 [Rhizobium leguminosarum bv. viciae]TCA68215.1 hypothetical protein E0H69_30695 [Rhizobium leguminosarum bv. viciae]